MVLLNERLVESVQKHADALRKARDAADMDQQRFVERTDKVRHHVKHRSSSLHLLCFNKHANITLCERESEALTMHGGCRNSPKCARNMRHCW